MKKLLTIICTFLLCASLGVNAKDSPNACQALSDERQVCAINEEGECECADIIQVYNIGHQGGGK